jgi:acyl phosphate:glycerol-3-phosphate acyltransferase
MTSVALRPFLSIAVAYLLGSIPFALLLARRWGTHDLHLTGSGNIGAANVFRASGPAAGLLVALLDIGKGAAGVCVAMRLNDAGAASACAGFAAVIGHVYPVWLRFRGGKGVATACGAFAVLAPIPTLAACLVFAVGMWSSRYVSIGSVLASTILPPLAYALGSPHPVVLAALASATLIVFRHRSNLARVRLGTERRLARVRPREL